MLRTRFRYRAVQGVLWTLSAVGFVLLVIALVRVVDARFSAEAMQRLVHTLLIPILPLLVLPAVVNLSALSPAYRYHAALEAVRRGDIPQVPVASHQPDPGAIALPLPITIRLRPRWHMVATLDLIFFLVIGLYALAYLVTSSPTFSELPLAAAFVFIILAILYAATMFSQRTSGNGVTVSDEGLTMHLPDTPAGLYAIDWSEARLFVIAVGRKRRPGVVVYTLAAPGPGKFVNWPRLCHPPRWYSTQEPTVPFPEYERDMQALVGLVMARTGLPLRDLR